jgi:hypothetical protein
LVNSLFLSHLNAEELYSSIQNVEFEETEENIDDDQIKRKHYHDNPLERNTEIKSGVNIKKFDKHADRFIFHLQGILKEEVKESIVYDSLNEYTRKSSMR